MNRWYSLFFLVVLTASAAASAQVSLKDPKGDDDGPGTYKYPSDAVYKPGSFDLTSLEVETKGDDVIFRVGVGAKIEDPWNSKTWPGGGNGFSLQFVQVYIDTDHRAGNGFCDGLPGLNVRFQPASCWEKVVLISPQPRARLESEVGAKAGAMKAGVVIPKSTRVEGKTLVAVVKASELGGTPAKGWGYQAVMQSNEGYPKGKDLLTRKVNEIAGDHRFGGGSDWECDPHVIDILAGAGRGGNDEVGAQHAALKYNCSADGAGALVELPMVYP